MMSPASKRPESKRPSGRAEITDAVLDAATELFGERGPANVSVRDVASKAGVQHSVVHRYFGTKQDLFREVIARGARREAEALNDPATTSVDRLAYALQGSSYTRALLWASLEGWDLGQFEDSGAERYAVAMVESGELRPSAEHPGFDPRLVIGMLTASAYGWIAMGDRIKRQMGLTGVADDVFLEELSRVMTAVMALADPSVHLG